MNFIPNTEKQRLQMLEAIGVEKIDGLFKEIPESIRLKESLKLPEGMSELELRRLIKELSHKNRCLTSFQGAGAYHHFVPAVVDHIISRAEFYTAYTPYQAEVSQGILQAVFEYQTMICELTGMDVANASMYEGASALAEATVICKAVKDKNEIIVSKTVHPEYRQTLKTYAKTNSTTVKEIGFDEGKTDIEELKETINENSAAIVVQSPNFFGIVEELKEIGDLADSNDAMFVVSVVEPTSLGLLKPPGSLGADIVVGEGQSFGSPLNFGGPFLGIIATKKKYMRKIPGRLVGETVDTKGRKGYVLTLQTREQHIRRERATSNICTNEALCALAATVYLAAMGKKLTKLAEINYQKAHYVYNELKKLDKSEKVFTSDFYNEFLIKFDNGKDAFKSAIGQGIVPGVLVEEYYPQLKDCLLINVTETATKEDIDRLIEVLMGI